MIAVSCTTLLFALVLFPSGVVAQGDPDPADKEPIPPKPAPPTRPPVPLGDAATVKSDFLVPIRVDRNVDKFVRGDLEYLFVNTTVTYLGAKRECWNSFQARLATVHTEDQALFLAEALSETQMIMDSLWVAGTLIKDTEDDWQWEIDLNTGQIENVTTEIKKHFKKSELVEANDRNCLTFARLDHDQPQFRPIACKVERGVLCQRPRGESIENGTTHPGWIKIGKRYYKIFDTLLNYTDADQECGKYDINANLAVIVKTINVELLGRYLLIGRPSLENAWIGGKWAPDQNQYTFEHEHIVLTNKSDDTDYPPWRTKDGIQKAGGCLLLDRHVSNFTKFVEARCDRLRPYICYKIQEEGILNVTFTDVIIGDRGYRLIYDHQPWEEAFRFCKEQYVEYGAFLTEIADKTDIHNLLYVMGENRTALQHIWLGGKYTNATWFWQTNVREVKETENLNWITNETYTPEVEDLNNCLNMDRENHLTALHYGTNCKYGQSFTCYFKSEDLRRLQEIERNATRLANDE